MFPDVVAIDLVLLLQSAHDTSVNWVHFVFLLSELNLYIHLRCNCARIYNSNRLDLLLQQVHGISCNHNVRQLVHGISCNHGKYLPFSCNLTVVWVAIDVHFELQILSGSHDTVLIIQLQPDSDSICNWCTLRVANTECFTWNCTTPSVATRQWFELQLMYTPSCK
jgi:hypothetical protein